MYQREFIGNGSISYIQSIIDKHNANNIFLVTGKDSYAQSGAETALSPYLKNKHVTKFSDFNSNPQKEDVQLGVKLLKTNNPDLIIAVGGGSVIDMAKLINIVSSQPHNDISAIITDRAKIQHEGLPLIAIPTTIGTGSEATHFAVIYINKSKYSLAHHYIVPKYSIVDPVLTYQLPSKIAALSAMDALSQAIESYWAVNSTQESKEYASRAIKMILPVLDQAVNTQSHEAKDVMALAANLSGKAINISKTTAAHAISYPITSYFGVAHGHAVALTLGEFFLINSNLKEAELIDERGEKYYKKTLGQLYEIFGCSDAQSCHDKWHDLMDQVGLKRDLNVLGIRKMSDIQLIINDVNIERLRNNPVRINNSILYRLWNKLAKSKHRFSII